MRILKSYIFIVVLNLVDMCVTHARLLVHIKEQVNFLIRCVFYKRKKNALRMKGLCLIFCHGVQPPFQKQNIFSGVFIIFAPLIYESCLHP